MANTEQSRPTTFSGAMRTLGGIAGFLWGGTAGDADPEIGFWAGALVGTILGVLLGWGASLAVRVAFHVGFLVLVLALIALRVLWLFSALG